MIILKNAYVLAFDKKNSFGRYSLLISDNKISDIADDAQQGEGKVAKWIEQHGRNADVVDCSGKIVMPPFVNSCVKSEGSLIHYLLKRRHYEKAEEDLCTDLIFNYLYQELPGEESKTDLANIYNYSSTRLLKSGIVAFNEFSLRRDMNHLSAISDAVARTGQSVSAAYSIKQDANAVRGYKFLNPSYYLTQESQLTVYDISNIAELRAHGVRNLFLEVAVNKEVTDNFRLTFHKSVISVLNDYGLIDQYTSLINPLYLDYNDLKIITERRANIILCPRDLNHFTNRYFPIDDFIGHGIRFSIATGWLGEDLLKDVRLFRNKYKELNISSVDLLMAITKIPYRLYFNGDNSGYDFSIDINKHADMILIDVSDTRFQFFPEDFKFENVCDFLIDNLTSYNVSDVIIGGRFKVRDGKPAEINEGEIITSIKETRERLYKTGKYEELKRKSESRRKADMLDMSGRTGDEIKLFSETPENSIISDTKEEFRIKNKIPLFKPKPAPGQRSLFEELEHGKIISSDDFTETPEINFLEADLNEAKPLEREIIEAKEIDETIMKRLGADVKLEKQKTVNSDSKVELPKNVKLKFGDD